MAESGCLSPLPRNMERRSFIARFGGIYEHSPWIAAALHDRGLTAAHDTAEGLAAALASIVAEAGEPARLALIHAHPDLAGRAAIAGELTGASRTEQAGAGLDACSPEEFARFRALNDAYKERFGFPFVIAVAGRDRQAILAAFESRLGNDPGTEFRTALAEIDSIARLRLKAMAQAPPGPFPRAKEGAPVTHPQVLPAGSGRAT